jgi:hypothetical protein
MGLYSLQDWNFFDRDSRSFNLFCMFCWILERRRRNSVLSLQARLLLGCQGIVQALLVGNLLECYRGIIVVSVLGLCPWKIFQSRWFHAVLILQAWVLLKCEQGNNVHPLLARILLEAHWSIISIHMRCMHKGIFLDHGWLILLPGLHAWAILRRSGRDCMQCVSARDLRAKCWGIDLFPLSVTIECPLSVRGHVKARLCDSNVPNRPSHPPPTPLGFVCILFQGVPLARAEAPRQQRGVACERDDGTAL